MEKEIKFYTDHQGFQVPARNVTQIEKKKDRLSQSSVKTARALEEALLKFKKKLVADCDALFQQMLDQHEIKQDHKGNYTITSFDKTIKIEVATSNRIEFDDNITLAQAKINEYIEKKTNGLDGDLQKIIQSAFTRQKGTLDAKRILPLKKLGIKHTLWVEAMELIDKSISTNSSKRYFSVWQKNSEGEYEAVCLNFSNL